MVLPIPVFKKRLSNRLQISLLIGRFSTHISICAADFRHSERI
nr:MAG TPA: hypothetical protein [Caudoviricetes sp.]